MAAGTLCSRVTGLLRAVLLVWVIGGTSAQVGGQAFAVANELPTNLYALIAGGALGAVLLPQLVRAGREVAERIFTICAVGSAVVAMGLTFAAPWLVRAYASSWPPGWVGLTVVMTYWCMPQVFFYAVFAFMSQYLNAGDRYRAAAWAPVAANLVQIAGLMMIVIVGGVGDGVRDWSPGKIAMLCGASTAGVAAQAAIVWWAVARTGGALRLRWGMAGLAAPTRLAAWTFAGVVCAQLNYLVLSNVTTTAGHALNRAGVNGASMNSLSNAYLLVMVPFGVIVMSIITVVYTAMNVAHAQGRPEELFRQWRVSSRQVSVVCWWAAALFAALGPRLSVLLWGTPIIGNVAAILALSSMSMGQLTLSNRTALVLGRGTDLFWTQLTVACVTSASALASLVWLPAAHVVYGIAAGTVLANCAGAALGGYAIRRSESHSNVHGAPAAAAQSAKHVGAVATAALVAAACAHFAIEAAPTLFGGSRGALVVTIPASAALATGAYLICLAALGKRRAS